MGLKKLDGQSDNITEEQKAKLKELFPEVFAEDKVDWDKLKSTLGKEADLGERYGLSWKGKSNVLRSIQEATTKTLRPVRDESVNFDETENLFIEGDNLEALKILQRSYYGKVKMIYIDPPYNTGNDFVYNDKFAQSKAEYEEEAGIRDKNGKVTRTDGLRSNRRDGGHFHSNWLNMIYPRLFLARNLLKQDGVIFVSIDDNEAHNLRVIMNEIFGEENFLATLTRKTKLTSNKGDQFSSSHEYIMVYTKNALELGQFTDRQAQNDPKYVKLFGHEDERGKYNEVSLYMPALRGDRPSRYSIKCPDGSLVIPPGDRFWRWSEKTLEDKLSDNRVVFKKTKTSPLVDEEGNQAKWNIYTKLYLHERLQDGLRPNTTITEWPNSLASKEFIRMGIPFPYAKPWQLIKYLVEICGVKKDELVLDFFAGSGSTAEAIMRYNLENSDNKCRWACVQLKEEIDSSEQAYKLGYKNIADLAKERIRRAAKKIKEENKEEKFDEGFKVLKVRDTNFKIWDSDIADLDKLKEQMKLHLDSVKKEAEEEDILLELMLKVGIEPTAEKDKKEGYWIVDKNLAICLVDKLSKELFQKILAEKPGKIILLDNALSNNDQLKANLLLEAEKNSTEILVI